MSHIDSFRHELVGLLGGLPVYHPLQVIDGDFYATPAQLVFGGGSGEHPALVFAHPEGATALFLKRELELLEKQRNTPRVKDDPLMPRLDEWLPVVKSVVPAKVEDLIDTAEWREADWKRWEENSLSPLLSNQRWADEMSFVEWLALGVGEFVYAAMPELAPDLLANLPDWRETKLAHMRYNNILAVPPGMPVYPNGGNAFLHGLRAR